MDSGNNAREAGRLADKALQTGRDAVEAAQGYASAARRTGQAAAHSIRSHVDDALEFSEHAQRTATAALDASRAYARHAVDAAGRRAGHVGARLGRAGSQGARYVADQPVRAAFVLAAGAAVLAALALLALNTKNRR